MREKKTFKSIEDFIVYSYYFDNGIGNVVKLADVIRKIRK